MSIAEEIEARTRQWPSTAKECAEYHRVLAEFEARRATPKDLQAARDSLTSARAAFKEFWNIA